MLSRPAARTAALAGAALVWCLPAPARAADDPGGTVAPDSPTLKTVTCEDGRTQACGSGRDLALNGTNLAGATKVVFRGGKGKADDRAAAPAAAADGALTVVVPGAARSGPVTVLAPGGSVTSAPVKLDPAGTTRQLSAADYVFPVNGKAEIGESGVQRFGGARGHEGQDVFAKCGTQVVANVAGTVKLSTFQGAAGNYVVVDGADGRSYAFMHLRKPSKLQVGDAVYAGEPIGGVGDTGRASGCHLHFEIWTAPGYYEGGEPIDPHDELLAWQKARAAKARKARAAKARRLRSTGRAA